MNRNYLDSTRPRTVGPLPHASNPYLLRQRGAIDRREDKPSL